MMPKRVVFLMTLFLSVYAFAETAPDHLASNQRKVEEQDGVAISDGIFSVTRLEVASLFSATNPDWKEQAFIPKICNELGRYEKKVAGIIAEIWRAAGKHRMTWVANDEERKKIVIEANHVENQLFELRNFCDDPKGFKETKTLTGITAVKPGDMASLRTALLDITRSQLLIYRTFGPVYAGGAEDTVIYLGEGKVISESEGRLLRSTKWREKANFRQ